VISDGGEIIVGDECSAPDVEKMVDNTLREMRLEVQDFSKLKSFPRCERGPVVIRLWW